MSYIKVVAAFMIVAAGAACAGAAPQEAPSDGGLAMATIRVKTIQRRFRHEQGLCLDGPCIQQGVNAIRTILRVYTVDALNRYDGDIVHVSADLRTITSAPVSGAGEPLWCTCVFRRDGDEGDRIISLNVIPYGPLAIQADSVIIQGFRRDGRRYVFAAETGDTFWGATRTDAFSLEHSSRAHELWIAVHGRIPGSSRNFIRAAIYGFDGYVFSELWRPPDREELALRAHPDEIDVYFRVRETNATGFDAGDWIHQILRMTVAGVVEGAPINQGPAGPPEHIRK